MKLSLLTLRNSTKLTPLDASTYSSISELSIDLRTRGCNGCSLGQHPKLHGPVLYRGNPEAKIGLLGEGPGLEEDKENRTFCGPAGRKLDEILRSIGLDPYTDCFLFNVIQCRPIAPIGSFKQNVTPKLSEIEACKPIVLRELELVNPKILVFVGMSAIKTFIDEARNKTMIEYAGKQLFLHDFPDRIHFAIYHPAVLLHTQKDPQKHSFYRQAMWDHIRTLKRIIEREI